MLLALHLNMLLADEDIPPADTTPNDFFFAPAINIALSTETESAEITISGLGETVPITVAGGEYIKNGGVATSSPGTTENGDTLSLIGISSASYSTNVFILVTVGTYSTSFRIRTIPDPAATAENIMQTIVTSIRKKMGFPPTDITQET